MTPEIRRAALRAAAKVALCTALPASALACGGSIASPSSTGDPATAPAATAKPYAAPAESVVAACREEALSATFPTTLRPGPNADLRVDEATRDCCQVLANHADLKMTFEWPLRAKCCDAIGWDAAATCTPWGPPVPAPMRGRRVARRRVRRS